MTDNCKKQVKKLVKGKNFVVSVDILQNNTNSDFQENVRKEYFKNSNGS